MKTAIIRTVLAVVVIGMVVGAWQVAYARGREEGVAAGVAIRTEFVQGRQGEAAPATGTATGAAGGAGGFTKPGAAGGTGGFTKPGGGGVNGRVEQIDGTTMTVATSEGSVTVTMADTTTIRKTVNGVPGDIKVGDRVVVIGERKNDKEVAATTVQIQPQ